MSDKRFERGLSGVWSQPIAVQLRKDPNDCWFSMSSLFATTIDMDRTDLMFELICLRSGLFNKTESGGGVW